MPLINGMKMAWYVLFCCADLTVELKTQASKRNIILRPVWRPALNTTANYLILVSLVYVVIGQRSVHMPMKD
jgi:hypothetical protein